MSPPCWEILQRTDRGRAEEVLHDCLLAVSEAGGSGNANHRKGRFVSVLISTLATSERRMTSLRRRM